MSKRYISELSSEEKDQVIEKLLNHLGLEVYDPYERGEQGVEIREKEVSKCSITPTPLPSIGSPVREKTSKE